LPGGLTVFLNHLGMTHSSSNLSIMLFLFRLKPLPPAPAPPLPSMQMKSLVPGPILSPTMRNFVRCAGLSGTLAIVLGVYGAHVMKENTPDDLKRVCI
jgi:hypothetical protein